MKLFRRGSAMPLFLRTFLLMLACVAVVQLLNLALLVFVQPPPPRVYTVGEIAKAVQDGHDASGELEFTQRVPTDPAIWAPRTIRIRPAIALVLGVPENRVEFGFVTPPFPQRAPTRTPLCGSSRRPAAISSPASRIASTASGTCSSASARPSSARSATPTRACRS